MSAHNNNKTKDFISEKKKKNMKIYNIRLLHWVHTNFVLCNM